MAGAQAGVVGQAEVNSPQGTPLDHSMSPSTWVWVWLGLAVLVVLGFHVRIFGVTVPPVAVGP